MKTYSGFSETTAKHLVLDAGAYFINYDPETDTPEEAFATKCLGATSGGGQFNAKAKFRNISVDGVKAEAPMGLKFIDTWEVELSASVIEIDHDVIKYALAASDKVEKEKYTEITARNNLELSDYISNVTWVGTLSGCNDPIIIQVFNAISEEGLSLKAKDGDDTTVELKFIGHYNATNLEDLQSPPFKILYPKVSA